MWREHVTPKPLVFIHGVSGESTDTECSHVSRVKELHVDSVVFSSDCPLMLISLRVFSPRPLVLHFSTLFVLTLSETAIALQTPYISKPSDQRFTEKSERRRELYFIQKPGASRVNRLNPCSVWCI